jgi:hypothetical protein
VPKTKKKKIAVNYNEERSLPSFVIDLRKKEEEKEPEKLELKTNSFLDYLKKIRIKNSDNLGFPFKDLLKTKKTQAKIINPFYKYRKTRILNRKVKDFSKVVNNFRDTLNKYKFLNKHESLKKADDYIYKINWYRSALSFIIILILLIIPFKALDYLRLIDLSSLEERVMIHSQAAIDNLLLASHGVSQASLEEAEINFSLASESFIAAQEELGNLQSWLLIFASFSNNPKIKLASESKNLLNAGISGASLGENFSKGIDALINSQEENWLIKIDRFNHYSNLALIDLIELKFNLEQINYQVLPSEYQTDFIHWRDKISVFEKSLNSLIVTADKLKEFLGHSHNRRYLLVFQNNTEMRASGGFMGSYALVDFKNGKLDNIEVPAGGTYDTEAGMRSFIRSPRPLWLVNPRWYFWDANWWPDWPTTASNLMWFYEKSDGPTVDGVISFTPDVLESFLKITGPVYLKDYQLTINSDNFWLIIQSTVEKQNLAFSHPEFAEIFPNSPEDKPKKIIGDLMEHLLEILPEKINPKSLPLLIELLEKDWRQKNILFYFNDDNLQNLIKDWGLDASIKKSRHDYLLITHSNIAGQKSDRKMKETIFLDSQILIDGRIINELTIIREHQGIKNQALTGARNVDWLRVYVPKNSRLIEASGFSQPDKKYFKYPELDWEIHPLLAETEELAIIDKESGLHVYEEFDKTVFANWVMTDPGEKSVVKIRYELPFIFDFVKRDRNYLDFINHLLNINQERPAVHSLLVQKQAGLKPSQFFSRLRLASNWQLYWRYPEHDLIEDAWLINEALDSDKFWAILALPSDK